MDGVLKQVLCVLLALAAGCGDGNDTDEAAPVAPRRLRLATTTSLDNSGLTSVLLPPFEKRYGVRIDVIAVGTGRALQLGRDGDVDVLIVHHPEGEAKFIAEGAGVNHRRFMRNDFLILGPEADPAGLRKASDVARALTAIAVTKKPFVSRGDDSGTHRKEQALWKAASVEPAGRWYIEAGQGMSITLMMADEKQAYVLADRGTYLAFKDKIKLVPLHEGDPALRNPYAIIAVNPARWRHANYLDAMLLVGWVTSPEGQKIIGDFRLGGERLFVPDAVPATE